MLTLDRTNPNFDEALEVLCLLPRHPLSVPLDDIAEDIGAASHSRVRDAFQKLMLGWDVRVKVAQGGGAFVACIAPGAWERAKDLGEKYLASLHQRPAA